jgi:hypothetical protein
VRCAINWISRLGSGLLDVPTHDDRLARGDADGPRRILRLVGESGRRALDATIRHECLFAFLGLKHLGAPRLQPFPYFFRRHARVWIGRREIRPIFVAAAHSRPYGAAAQVWRSWRLLRVGTSDIATRHRGGCGLRPSADAAFDEISKQRRHRPISPR